MGQLASFENLENTLTMTTEIATKVNFSTLRYAQCWEDADILLEALNVQAGAVCISIASAGDNTLSLLTQNPGRVIALDLSPTQLACLELRVAAYRTLTHPELLELMGSRTSAQRTGLYQRCRGLLSETAQQFWDSHPQAIQNGIGSAGKFERYFALFRNYILPLIHAQPTVDLLLQGGNLSERTEFYTNEWDNWRWQLLFRLFFSRFVMGQLGRDPSFFNYVEGAVSTQILQRVHYATTQLNPAENPYMQWILTGHHCSALPHALRPENFELIRANLNRLEWHCLSIEDFLANHTVEPVDCYNLSDIFEYMSPENYQQLLEKLVAFGRLGGRLAYWNMLVPRSRPACMSQQLAPLSALAQRLHLSDKAFFYRNFVVEEILAPMV
jgi:S-adenosylmethionine-diacylglycerol 3-amino-3-carboxypropyl transferase